MIMKLIIHDHKNFLDITFIYSKSLLNKLIFESCMEFVGIMKD
jgi:hypothetical protein